MEELGNIRRSGMSTMLIRPPGDLAAPERRRPVKLRIDGREVVAR
jgi:hypothetical protein